MADSEELSRSEITSQYKSSTSTLSSEISVIQQLKAPITLNERMLRFIAGNNDSTTIAVVLLVIAKLLDFTAITPFNIRLELYGDPNLFTLILHPMFIALNAVVIAQLLKIYGIQPPVESVFRLLCFSMVWSIISWIFYLIISFLPWVQIAAVLNLVVTAAVAFGFFMTIALGVRQSKEEQNVFVIGLFVISGVLLSVLLIFGMFLLTAVVNA